MQSTHVSQNATKCAVTDKLYCAVFGQHLTTSLNYLLVDDTLATYPNQINENKTLSVNVSHTFLVKKTDS